MFNVINGGSPIRVHQSPNDSVLNWLVLVWSFVGAYVKVVFWKYDDGEGIPDKWQELVPLVGTMQSKTRGLESHLLMVVFGMTG